MTVDQHFNVLNDKLQNLIRQYQKLQKENLRLKEEMDQAKKQQQQQVEAIESLQQQISILKISSGEMNEADKKEFEKKIGQYIREVDKCIAFLSQ